MILSDGDRYVDIRPARSRSWRPASRSSGSRGGSRFCRSAATFGALAFSTFTVVVLQAPTALNDLVVAGLSSPARTSRREPARGARRSRPWHWPWRSARSERRRSDSCAGALRVLHAATSSVVGARRTGIAGFAGGPSGSRSTSSRRGTLDRWRRCGSGTDPLGELDRRSVVRFLELSDVENTALLRRPSGPSGADGRARRRSGSLAPEPRGGRHRGPPW